MNSRGIWSAALLIAALLIVLFAFQDGKSQPHQRVVNSDGGYTLACEGELVIASSMSNPPYEQGDAGVHMVGFSFDLYEGLASRLGLRATIVEAEDPCALVRGVNSTADVAVDSLTLAAVPSGLLATDGYLHQDIALVALENSTISGMNDCVGKKIAVVDGSKEAYWLAKSYPSLKAVRCEDWADVWACLLEKRCDAAVMDEPRARRGVGSSYSEARVVCVCKTDVELVAAVSSDNGKLADAINAALDEMRSDGSYDALYDQWFGAGALANPGVENPVLPPQTADTFYPYDD